MTPLAWLNKNRTQITSLLVITLVWCLLLLTSGAIASGYHFTDDHEIAAIYHDFHARQLNVIEVIAQWLTADHLSGRFRPFYYIHRILETRIFGINLSLWSLYTACLGVLTTGGVFWIGRRLQLSWLAAILFGFLTTLGAQSAVWWQLGPAETIGTFLLVVTLVIAAKTATANRDRWLYDSLFIGAALLMSLCKENFVVTLPAIAFAKIWFTHDFGETTWRQAIYRNWAVVVLLGLICGAELWFIKQFVGLRGTGYAGVSGFNWGGFWRAAITLNQYGAGWLIAGSCLIALLADRQVPIKSGLKELGRSLTVPLLFGMLLVLPQLVVYAKSDLSQRYLLPGIFAYALITIWLYQHIQQHSRPWGHVVLGLIGLVLAWHLNTAWRAAHIFGLEGRSTQALLEAIATHTQPSDPIVLVTNPRVYQEWNLSLKEYLSYVADRDNLYVETYSPQNDFFWDYTLKIYENRTLSSLTDKAQVQCVVVFPELNKAFLRRSLDWFDPKRYQVQVFGHFNRNLNPDSEIHLYCQK